MSATRAPSRHHHVCLHDENTACGEIGFNTFEDMDTTRYPQGDVMNVVGRGAITKAWNLGLRNPQAKKLTVDVYNGGCRDLYSCVPGVSSDVPDFGCKGNVRKSMGPDMQKAYNYLNAPLLADGFEYHPPDYMMGIKDSGPNSVEGWNRTSQGLLVWEKMAHDIHRVTGPPASGPGCG